MPSCRFCGYAAPKKDFEVDRDGAGFWCPDCDGFTYFDESSNEQRRMLLLLESTESSKEQALRISPPPVKLRKRLSPLRYPGGKSKVIDYLYEQLQNDKLDTFVEVFAGGASLGLSLLYAGVIQKLHLNDIDPGVSSLWKTILERPGSLLERLNGPAPCAGTYWELKALLSKPGAATEDLAWAQLVVNRLSFSGITSANPMGGKNGSPEKLLCRWNPEELARRIRRIHEMRERIVVTSLDCEVLIEEAYWPEHTTLFCDPPYLQKGPQLYPHAFEEEQHKSLAFLLGELYRGMPGADIIITYDDHPEIRRLYPYAEHRSLPRKYSIAGGK